MNRASAETRATPPPEPVAPPRPEPAAPPPPEPVGRREPGRVGPAPEVPAPVAASSAPPMGMPQDGAGPRATCTGAQLRRFIKSRPWVPMHELRRRFGINGADDDVTPITVGDARLFVGLPGPEGQVLGELLRSGDVGYELSVDPFTPVVIGVYPMRPVPRS